MRAKKGVTELGIRINLFNRYYNELIRSLQPDRILSENPIALLSRNHTTTRTSDEASNNVQGVLRSTGYKEIKY